MEPKPLLTPPPLPVMTRNLWGDVRSFLLRSPARETLIEFPSLEERKSFSDRILQRVDIDVSPYSVLNLHQIGIHAPVGHVFEELTRWDSTSAFWPNRLATVERVDGGIDQLRFHPLGLVDPEGGGGRWLPPLFELTALRIQKVPGPTDVDNARYLLYACSGGYPIGIFALYVRSAITEQGETEASQLFLGVGFDFYGKKQGFFFHPMNWLWEKIHNRVTANVLDLFKKTCESRFPLQAKRESESDGT